MTLRSRFSELCGEVGLQYGSTVRNPDGKLVQGVVPYSLRHYCATRMILAGNALALIAQGLGTSERVLKEHYSHITPDDLDQLVADSWTDATSSEDGVLPFASGA